MKLFAHSMALLTALYCTGCTTTLPLPDRISYASEKEISQSGISTNKLSVSGNISNRKISVAKSADGFCGGGHTSTFNVGEVFNLYLEQIAKAAQITCNANCTTAEVSIESADLAYSLDCMRGTMNTGSFRARLTYRITSPNGSIGIETKDYASRTVQVEDERNPNVLYPITKSIESIAIQSMIDLSKMIKLRE